LEDPIKNKYIVLGATNSYGTVKPQMEAGISGFSLSTQRKDVNLCVKFQALRSWVTKSLILPILGKSQNVEKIKESIAKYKTNIEALFKELGYLK
jgi:hypothetical protein